MGGVGKTAICRVLAHQCAKLVNAVIWLEGHAGLENGLQTVIAPKLGIDIQHPDWLGLLMDRFNQCEPPSVLFLDNLEQSDANMAILNTLKRLNWHLIATSRYPLTAFTMKHEVNVLSPEQCVALFIQHYDISTSKTDQVTLNALIELAGRHTLTVELLAKVAKDGLLDVPQLFEQVKRTGFDLSGLTDTTAEGLHRGTELQSQRQHQLHEHLSKLFQLASLAEEEQTILRTLSTLPYQAYHGKNELMVWLGLDKPQPLINLTQKGWLQRMGLRFAVHPVVADVAKHQVALDLATLRHFAERFGLAIQPGETGHWIAQAGYASSLEALIEALSEDETVKADLLSNLATIHDAKGEYDEALSLFQRVLTGREKTYGQYHPKIAVACNDLGLAYYWLKKYDKAIEFYQLALTSDLKTYGEGHPNVAIRHNNLGGAYKSLAQYEKAIDYYQQALNSDLKTYEEDHPTVARAHNNLGGAYYALGQYEKAIGYFQQALTSDLKTYGADHPHMTIRRYWLGVSHASLGNYYKAIEYLQLAQASFEKTFDQQHPYIKGVKSHLEAAKTKLKKIK